MENKKEEKKGKKLLKNLTLVAITVGICYEIFGRKGQDVKGACNWVKNKIQSGRKHDVEPNQNRQNNNGGWNGKHKN